MSDTLRATSDNYATQLKAADSAIANHQKTIDQLQKKKADLVVAKKAVDDALSKLPAPAPKATPQP